MELAFETLRDVTRPYGLEQIKLLNTLVAAIYSGSPQERVYSNKVLTDIKENPAAWSRCEEILLSAETSIETKFFSLSIYDSVTVSRWMELPREKILGTVMELIRTVAIRGVPLEKPLLRKLDKVFVNAVKSEWLNNTEVWKSVIPQLATLSGSDQNLWENTMTILNMLSEDIFDFGAVTMTSRKVVALKDTLSEQFPHVERLCTLVFEQYVQSPNTVKPSLVNAALCTIGHYLKWVPQSILFQSSLVDLLLVHFWDPPIFRIETIKCLSEVFSVSTSTAVPANLSQAAVGTQKMTHWFGIVCAKMMHAFSGLNSISSNERLFYETMLNQISILFTSVAKANVNLIADQQILFVLIRCTERAGEEGFKSFVAFWCLFTDHLVEAARKEKGRLPDDIMDSFVSASGPLVSAYLAALEQLGKSLVLRMAQPPEVTISETDDGQIERADIHETAEVDLYLTMSKCLQNLTFINRGAIENTLLSMLKELAGTVKKNSSAVYWDSQLLSKIVWSAGSIAGVTPTPESEGEERRFTFEIIRELLGLCNLHNSKTNRAVVAANVLFYCSRHHRFLRSNHKFLRTVYKKLFEFMAEPTPGVKEMACDTFLIISRHCAHKLVVPIEESGAAYAPFVDSLVGEVAPFLVSLEPMQKCTIYEGIGCIIGALGPGDRATQLCVGFLTPYLSKWQQILLLGNSNPAALFELEVTRELSLFLRVFDRLAVGVGNGATVEPIVVQIYEDILRLYKVYSETVAREHNMVNWEAFKLMRRVKGDCLRLISTFVLISTNPTKNSKPNVAQIHTLAANIVPRLLDYVLEDYKNAQIGARDFEVLVLVSSVARNLSESMGPAVGSVWDKIFGPTVEMLQDERGFPDHRLAFYTLLLDLTTHCFMSLVNYLVSSDQLGNYLESLVSGIRQENPQISNLALAVLDQFLELLGKDSPQIYTRIYSPLVAVILTVLTDKLHDSGKEIQVRILMHLLSVVSASPALGQAETEMGTLLSQIASQLLPAQREEFVKLIFRQNDVEKFKQLMNDLKITIAYGGALDL